MNPVPAHPRSALGPRLRAIRLRHGVGLRELARRLDLSPSAISRIETGKNQPSVRTLYAFASELQVTVDEVLFDGEGLAHPLLSGARAVRNDVRLGGELRVLVVSGSNMSGKSTLLRTAGINTVLAMAGAPVRAARLRLSPLAVGTNATRKRLRRHVA